MLNGGTVQLNNHSPVFSDLVTLGSRVGFIIDFSQMLKIQMGVDLCGADIRMTE